MLAASLKGLMLLALVLIVACARTPAYLVDNLMEGMGESAVIAALATPKSAFHVVHEVSLPKGDPRPPYSERTIAAAGVTCAHQLSDISISFYLEQLREVTCYPHDVEAMIDGLVRDGVIPKREREFTVVRSGIAIRGGQTGGRRGVTFSSERLSAEQRRWIAKYS